MGSVKLLLEDASLALESRSLFGYERIGAPSSFEVVAFAPEPIEADAVVSMSTAGLEIKASTIEIKDPTKQSGSTTHG
jgi:hypothetical protein